MIYNKLNDWEVRPKPPAQTSPIFDAVMADSDPDIFLAGNIFPRPVSTFPTPYDDFTDSILYGWAAYGSRYKAKVLGEFAVDNTSTPPTQLARYVARGLGVPLLDPANLSFLRNVA